MNYQLVETNQQLKDVCQAAATKRFVALDTEFIRTKTLYPQIGLIQMYDGDQLSLIDPISCSEFEPLITILEDQTVLKVLHSCSEDLETFKRAFAVMPAPIFDTQIAACLLGLGETLGYAALIKETLTIELDKSESRTDWLRRPLSDLQLNYAAADVFHLYSAFLVLEEKIIQQQRFDWVLQETELLCEKKNRLINHATIYLHIKNSWQLSPRELAVLRELAAWRQKTAEKYDIALNFVVKEVNLLSLARRQPENLKRLSRVPGITPKEIRLYGNDMLQCIEDGKVISEQDCPTKIPVLAKQEAYKKALSMLKTKVAEFAEKYHVPSQMLASKKQLSHYLKWYWQFKHEDQELVEPDVIKGWRQAIFAELLSTITIPELGANK